MLKKYLLIFAIILCVISMLVYKFEHTKVVIEFEDLEPFKRTLPVYFKGFKLGRTGKVYPGKDFRTTRVYIMIRTKDIKFPTNTTAMVRRKDKKDYIELHYPTTPYLTYLKNNSVIKGTKGVNFENFLQDQADNGGLDAIAEDINTTVKAAGVTFQALTEMLQVVTGMLQEIRPTITDTVNNFNTMSKNLAAASYDVHNTLDQGYLDNTLANLSRTTENLAATTANVTGISNNVNTVSVKLLNCILQNVNNLINNINAIVLGVGNTLKKRMGGMRLIFGKGISN